MLIASNIVCVTNNNKQVRLLSISRQAGLVPVQVGQVGQAANPPSAGTLRERVALNLAS